MKDFLLGSRPILPEDVTWAYRIFLGRELENPAVAERKCTNLKTLAALREHMLKSKEFSLGGTAQRKQAIKVTPEHRKWALRLVCLCEEEDAPTLEKGPENLHELVNQLLAIRGTGSVADVEIILSKSMSRSGHHFLISMLQAYLGKDLAYCEFYTPKKCCHATPCEKPRSRDGLNRFFIQKSHDFGAKDRLLPEFKHIIQYRHPIARIQSSFERAIKDERLPEFKDDPESFRLWTLRQVRYFTGFYRKWVASPPPRSVIVRYESLLESPESCLLEVVEFITGEQTDPHGIREAVKQFRGYNVHRNTKFTPRKMEDHRFFDPKLFREVEAQVFEQCPGLDVPRFFS